MKNLFRLSAYLFAAVIVLVIFTHAKKKTAAGSTLFKNATIIDGNGGNPATNTDLLVRDGIIAAIGRNLQAAGAQVVDLSGKTLMPSLISTHVHIGTLKGTTTTAANYTRDNVLSQLRKYETYGVNTIQVMGTDRPLLFAGGLRDSSQKGLLPGARIYSAGYGFGTPGGGPPAEMGMDNVYRPVSASQVPAQMDSLARLRPSVVKMWIDNFNGRFKKMDPAVYKTIIQEAHKRGLRVAAHVYYLADARQLVADGIDLFAHSIRDSVIDDALIQQMKAKKVAYIPTLTLDEYAYVYANKPAWADDAFFKASLEPGAYELITSEKYQNDIKNSPQYAKNGLALQHALLNVKKLYAAGILVALGTDSGASPVRTQGFSEHLELELLVQAGLTPLQAMGAATRSAAQLLKIDKSYGTLEKGKTADMIVLSKNPVDDIRNTRTIEAVYKAGKQVSQGPVK
ncbi:MAG: amidohydrolase family protein [Williamsia sp.]|nr:amidohydrolase family protein [Williamsia sp.]